MSEMTVRSIGTVEKKNGKKVIQLQSKFSEGLTGLDGFGHVVVLWWADRYAQYRDEVPMLSDLPYAPGTQAGLLATRSPVRPNPIGINIAGIESVDVENGVIEVDEIDAFEGTVILDVKPYYGCIDRVKEYRQPSWVPEDWGEWYVPLPEMDYS